MVDKVQGDRVIDIYVYNCHSRIASFHILLHTNVESTKDAEVDYQLCHRNICIYAVFLLCYTSVDTWDNTTQLFWEQTQ